ncbi:MAG: hypothetical protein RRZ24_09750 [Clostridia bacterium]
MQFREITICLDTTRSLPFHPFEVVDGDTGNVLQVTLRNNGEEMLLNGCAICIAYTSSKGFSIQDETSGITQGTVVGTFTALLDPTDYGPGNVSADVQIYSGPNRKVLITSKRFDFRCRRSLISEDIIRANKAYPPLIAATQEARLAAGEARTAAAEINLVKGEMNVQADWSEVDASMDAFIRHKPYIPAVPADVDAAPTVHAEQHRSAGKDPLVLRWTKTLDKAAWGNHTQKLALPVTVNHVVFIKGTTQTDGERFADAGITVAHVNDGLQFSALAVPTKDICLDIAAL